MKAYWAVVSARFRMLLQYRAAAAAGFGTQLFFGLVRVMIFEAFYDSSTATHPMRRAEVITYLWLAQALLMLLPWQMDSEIRAMVRNGTVAYELLRPVDLYALWYSRALASRTAPVLLRALPMFLVAGLFLGLQPPPSWAAAGAWLLSLVGALLLSCAILSLMYISLLWTIAGDGISRLLPTAATIFSGAIIPLPFFPDWAQTALNFLPFRGLMDVPFRFYVGHLPPSQIVPQFASQLLWSAVLILLGRLALARGKRRLVIQGG